jgi:hypothetical protein
MPGGRVDGQEAGSTHPYGRVRALARAVVRIFLSHDPGDFAALPHDGESWD